MITVQNTINASIDKVWNLWTLPEHIQNWNYAFDDWHTDYAENDLQVNGKFKYEMAAKDKSAGFDFEGEYTRVEKYQLIEYRLFDNRAGSIYFENLGNKVKLTEVFEPAKNDSESMQKEWCQNVINNFKKYVENF
ncbi:SRPBCC domain-containing protein [Flavobacterium defluvii]|uniref:Activator of Hsp90 ATPase homolog 1-like protein n=1 Tax=Flavobacterium defluvii TaxID=370979 RepID=A0A1M5ER53_9FLAO|nr:SRPBCC domain-containing protein [Flavobacterium defluvii]SHF81601.1 Activator of Hsp90 ATPase homolog 1-like protein [Flavobacterium defluvii]